MERRDQFKVKSGKQFDHLFPKAMLTSITKKKGATVADTIKFIPQVVNDTLFHTKKIAQVLRGNSVRDTCRNIWDFVYNHIAYKKDEDGKEQIRSPARTWHDRENIQGVDCDCYTTFISSILSNLKIRHLLRITKYKEDHFQHIYPIVPLDNGSYITIDCVVNHFNYEEPYSEKKDTKMDLEYLNGVNDSKNSDQMDLIGMYDDREAMSALGRLFKRSSGGGGKKIAKLKTALKKGLHLTNILNPATATIRAGVLLSAKLNVMKIGERLKWAYLSDADAQKRGIDMGKFAKLKSIKDKLEKIFYGMGGKAENLKKAILSGKGNKNHEVSGLGYHYESLEGINEYSSASTILGTEMYHDELSGVNDDNGELGIVTATAIASATGVVGAIAALIKSVGNIFPKNNKASKDFEDGAKDDSPTVETSSDNEPASMKSSAESGSGGSGSSGGSASSDSSSSDGARSSTEITAPDTTQKSELPASSASQQQSPGDGSADSKDQAKTADNADDKPLGFWSKHKKWLLPTSIGAGVLLVSYVGYRVVTKKETPKEKPALSGITKSKKRKKKGGNKTKIKSKKNKKEAVTLL